MKYILVLVILFSFSNCDEISRIESIVNDITDLRKKYKSSKEQLILKELNEKKQDEKILYLQNQIKKYKKQLKAKENQVKKLKPKKVKIVKKVAKPKKEKPVVICEPQKLENPNKFPKLILKPKYIKYKKVKIKAKTYKLSKKANVYDSIHGKIIDNWETDTTFTSNEKAIAYNQESWIKVTGYFIKSSWVPAPSKMWVKAKYIK